VLVVTRDIRSIISSWISLGWVTTADELAPTVWSRPERWLSGDETREAVMARLGIDPVRDDASPLERLTWLAALCTQALKQAAADNPDWEVVEHEALCADPEASLPELAAKLGLTWTQSSAEALADANQAGAGLERNRVAGELPTIWRKRLTRKQIRRVEAVLEGFPA
jgi:hypothetical protein